MSEYITVRLTVKQAIALSILLENVTNLADDTPHMRKILSVMGKLNAAGGWKTLREGRRDAKPAR